MTLSKGKQRAAESKVRDGELSSRRNRAVIIASKGALDMANLLLLLLSTVDRSTSIGSSVFSTLSDVNILEKRPRSR